MADALSGAPLLYARWLRAVDLLWRETVRRRQADLDFHEQMRAEKRLRALRRIVRKALAPTTTGCSRRGRGTPAATEASEASDSPRRP